MIHHIKPPHRFVPKPRMYCIFVGGSIEGGTATEWQEQFYEELAKEEFPVDVVIFNPRRKEWHADWVQSIDNPPFAEQVNWELDHIETSNLVVMNFLPETKSPISLMELGMLAQMRNCDGDMPDYFRTKGLVLCPEPFWRKGNVDIVCKRYDLETANDMADLVAKTKEAIHKWHSIFYPGEKKPNEEQQKQTS